MSWVGKHPDLSLSRVFLDYCTETSIECLLVLLDSNRVDCTIADDISDHTPLHLLAIEGKLDAIKLCIKYKAQLTVDYYGRSPLHYAAMYGHTHVATFLIAVGSDVNKVDQDGNTPLIYAIIYGWPETLEALIQDDASIEPIHSSRIPITVACEYGRDSMVVLLLERGVKLLPTMDGLYPLHLACREGNVEITKTLISYGSDVERRDAFTGWTPLFYAASEGHLSCVQVLLEAKCAIDLTDDSGWQPWTYCLYRGHMKVAALLEPRKIMVGEVIPITADLIAPPPPPKTVKGLGEGLDELDIDDIPSLSLPPPIIPLRI
jgi:CDK inhibitor PHO81